MRFIICLLTGVFFVTDVFAMEIISHWTLPNYRKRDYETTAERTRPFILGDIVYSANLAGDVSAVHRTEGYCFWQKKPGAGVEGALSYGRSKVVVGDLQGNLIALNARDGSEAWRFKIQSEWISAPAIVRDKIYAATSNDELFALTETTGKEVWHYGHRGDEKMTIRGGAAPVVFGSELFQGFSDGSIAALDAASGKVLWTKKLKTKDRFYDVDATPYVDESDVIVSTFDGRLFNLDRSSGNTHWIHNVGSYGGYLVEEGRLYFAGLDGNLYALEKSSGKPLWKTPYAGGVGTAPTRVGDYLVFAAAGDSVYLVDAKDGKIAYTLPLAVGTLASPISTQDGWFYLLSGYGNLFSFELRKSMELKKGPQTLPILSATQRDLS